MATQDLIPLVGMKGTWQFAAPLNEIISATAVFECMAVRKLADAISAGEDVYARYYQNYGFTNVQYMQDVRDGVCIVSLVTGTGMWQYVPSNKITAFPVMTGVNYSSMVLNVALGTIPEDMDLSALITKITDISKAYTSITPTVRAAVISATTLKSQDEHDLFMANVQASRPTFMNDYERANVLNDEASKLRIKLAIAEQFIIDNAAVLQLVP